ncbi:MULTISPECIES: helix-turn-helix domain-containing protein [unclassified Variovorax]|uniref:helix-turn-helix domain-containing protein n=1 Tax=unclassified Variovorax TaxID=663243 RepID=UPI0034E8B482
MTTQRSLALRAGMSVSMLSRLERGLVTPSLKTLEQIAHALRQPVPILVDVQLPLPFTAPEPAARESPEMAMSCQAGQFG